MRRTNLVLDGDILEEARRALGTKTYSETVNKALAETVRQHKMRGIVEFFGKGLWQGDLSEMREDRPRHRVRLKKTLQSAPRKKALPSAPSKKARR
jgi:Arc/MetJ family transcription regulator